jgi:hypothetical protein
MSPCAPTELVAFGLNPDSCAMIARTSAGSTPSRADEAWISGSKSVSLESPPESSPESLPVEVS